jgi:type I restriction enzyme S subunit
MSALPPGWATASVGDVADLADGPFGSNLKTAHYTEDGPRVVRLQNIGEGKFRDERAHIAQAHYEQLVRHSVRPGDIVAASLGDDAPRACLVPSWLGPAIVKADCIRVRTRDGIEPGFLMWILNSPPLRRQAAAAIKGVGRPRLGLGGIRKLTIPVPPLKEQRRILAAIDEQLSHLDAAEKSLAQAKRRTLALRAAVVANAMRPDWPQIQVGDIGDGSRHALAIGPFGSNLKVSDYRVDGTPVIFVRNIRARQFGGPGSKFISERKAAELSAHTARGGDVLVTKMGDPPGDAAVYPEGSPDALITADCIKISVGEAFDARFVALTIGSPAVRRDVLAATKGVAQKKVSLGRFKKIEIPAPPLDEQRRVAAEIEQQLSIADSLSSAIEAACSRSAGLRRAILERAFQGELVAQDPIDDPAPALLERIAVERATVVSSRRRTVAR